MALVNIPGRSPCVKKPSVVRQYRNNPGRSYLYYGPFCLDRRHLPAGKTSGPADGPHTKTVLQNMGLQNFEKVSDAFLGIDKLVSLNVKGNKVNQQNMILLLERLGVGKAATSCFE